MKHLKNKLKEEFYKNWLEIKIGTPKFNGKTLADDIWNWINQNYISKEEIKKTVPKWMDNPLGEVNSYTVGRRDERLEIREKLLNLLNNKDDR